MSQMVPCPAGQNCLTNNKLHRSDSKQYKECLKYSKRLKALNAQGGNTITLRNDFDNNRFSEMDEEIMQSDLQDISSSYAERISKKFPFRKNNIEYDDRLIAEQEGMNWGEEDAEDVQVVGLMYKLMEETDGNLSKQQKTVINNLYNSLSEYTPTPKSSRKYSYSSSDPEHLRDGNRRTTIHSLANYMMAEANSEPLSDDQLQQKRGESLKRTSRLSNAQSSAEHMFDVEGEFYFKALKDEKYKPSKYLNAAVNSFLNGENKYGQYSYDEANHYEEDFYDPYKTVVTTLLKDNGLYNAIVFPEKNLAPKLDQKGIKNVSVDTFFNGREYGNVYTVEEPNGDTMSFSVYTHRNSDNIIINGTRNWDKNDLPYFSDYKHDYFASFSDDEHEKAAETLSELLKKAQNGEVKDIEGFIQK